MSEVRDPRWNSMCGDAPGPGDPRIWEDDLQSLDGEDDGSTITRHMPLSDMDTEGRRFILWKPCGATCLTSPPVAHLHGHHQLYGETYGLGSGHDSRLFHPVSPEYVATLPSANISHALVNIRAEPSSKTVWLKSGDKNGLYRAKLLTAADFANFDVLRQQTVRTMEQELAARARDRNRDVEPSEDLGIWMGAERPDKARLHHSFASTRSAFGKSARATKPASSLAASYSQSREAQHESRSHAGLSNRDKLRALRSIQSKTERRATRDRMVREMKHENAQVDWSTRVTGPPQAGPDRPIHEQYPELLRNDEFRAAHPWIFHRGLNPRPRHQPEQTLRSERQHGETDSVQAGKQKDKKYKPPWQWRFHAWVDRKFG